MEIEDGETFDHEDITVYGEINNYGTISNGTFDKAVTNKGTIDNGTFNGTVTNEFGCNINDGTFNGKL